MESRMGDRPTATILHAQFHLFIFGSAFKQNIRPKYAPLRRTKCTLKWRGGEARGRILVEYFALKPEAKIKKYEIAHAEL